LVVFSQAATVSIVLNWGGCGYCNLCGSSQYNLNNGNSGCNNNVWTQTKSFNDPIPAGNKITQVSVTTTRMFWCTSPVTTAAFSLQSTSIGSTSHNYDCSCGSCPSASTVTSSVYSGGFPGYVYGGSNTLNISPSGVVGIGDITVTFTYEVAAVCGNQIIETGEQCDGGDCCSNCQFTTVQCRAANGDCDVAEFCTGSSSTCPSNTFKSNSVICRASLGVCDGPEHCTGSSRDCPSDAPYLCNDCSSTPGSADSSCPVHSYIVGSGPCAAGILNNNCCCEWGFASNFPVCDSCVQVGAPVQCPNSAWQGSSCGEFATLNSDCCCNWGLTPNQDQTACV
jgi:hypothetical protein